MTCWQVYQPPGLESRGLYGPGENPAANEPNDPYFGVVSRVKDLTAESLGALLTSLSGDPVPGDLARVLLAPARDEVPELIGGDS